MKNEYIKNKISKLFFVFFALFSFFSISGFIVYSFYTLSNKSEEKNKEIKNKEIKNKENYSFKNYKIENKGDLSLDLKGVNTLEVKNSGKLNMAVSTDYVGMNLYASDCNEKFVFHSRSSCQ